MENNLSFLDKVRLEGDIEECRAVFSEAYKQNGGRAAGLINDHKLSFPCLFALLPQIESFRLYRYLSERNIIAIRIVNQILHVSNLRSASVDFISGQRRNIYSVLKWIFETGCNECRLGNDYEKVMDITISALTTIYRDKKVLPVVSDMIFIRNREGRNIHGLVWAYFKSGDIEALKLIAERISSPDTRDAELARSLLGLSDNSTSPESYIKWVEENAPYLYFTDESLQYSSEPVHCTVDMERKYLQKKLPSHHWQPLEPSSEEERKCLKAFSAQSKENKKILSEYSCKIHRKNYSEWEKWIRSPIEQQIKTAKAGLEVAE